MKHQTQMIVIALAVTAVAATQPALAQSERKLVGGPLPFSNYDTNGDGTISKQEFDRVQAEQNMDRAAAGARMGGAANTPTFAAYDQNGDGTIAPAEFTAVQPVSPPSGPGTLGSGPQMGLSAGMGAGVEGDLPRFADLDENHDGSLSQSEFNDARANRAVEKSQQGLPVGSLRNAPRFGDLDLNGDGRISPEEFASAQAQHSPPMQPQPR